MVNPSGTAVKEVSPSAAEKHWKDTSAQVAEEAGSSQSSKEPAQLEFDITYVQTNADACKALHRALSDLRSAVEHWIGSLSHFMWHKDASHCVSASIPTPADACKAVHDAVAL